MRITVIGTGYVGLVTGACFSEMGNDVICMDVDEDKILKLQKGSIPIYEPGLEKLVKRNIDIGNLSFTNKLKGSLDDVEVVFIAVDTPIKEDGSADLQYVFSVAKEIGMLMKHGFTIVNKSTVPVGTAVKVKETIKKELNKRNTNFNFDIVSNPEFLKEGNAINDFMKPDRIVIGAESDYAFSKMKELYSTFFRTHDRFITMDLKSAEMTKYAANAMLATKISFINEIANICELTGADVNKVRVGIGSDSRIGYDFIYPGIGYGGHCFPKDIKVLKKIAEENSYNAKLIESINEINVNQKKMFVSKILKCFNGDISGLTFSVWGLAFKPGTDDMREAPSIYIINQLEKKGAKIKVYDPKAMDKAKSYYLKDLAGIAYFEDKYKALIDSDALLLLTEWKEFRSPNFNKIFESLKKPLIFDGRNQYNVFELEKKGFNYYQVGK